MATQQNSTRALFGAIALGTLLQVVMVVVGNSVAAVANMFAVIGIAISIAVGLAYAYRAGRPSRGDSATGAAIAAGASAMLGILLSYYLGDVTASILLIGTLSSTVAGAIGGITGHMVAARSTSPA